MRKRTLGIAVLAVAIAATVPTMGSASHTTATKSTSTPRINVLGGGSFVANRYIQDQMRFDRDVYRLKSGSTIQIRTRAPGEPHTVSIVSPKDVPKTMSAIEKCFEAGICGRLGQAHEVPEGEGPPGKPVVDVGKPGFDRAGDSVVFGPRPSDRATVKLTAPRGKTLSFICAVHPWMQAKIVVR